MYEQRRKDLGKAAVSTVLALARTLGCRIEDLLEPERRGVVSRRIDSDN